jgi:hypothetical protein
VLLRGNDVKPAAMVASADKTEPPVDKAVGTTPDTKPPEVKAPEVKPPEPIASAPTTPDSGSAAKDPRTVAGSEPPPEPKRPAVVHKPPPAGTTQPAQPRPPRPVERAPVPAAKDPPPPKDTGKETCDEVSCVLNNYEGACCAKFRRGGKAAAGGDKAGGPKSDLPEALDRTMISEGVAKVKARVMSCGDKSPAKGQVKVSVKVNPDGAVTNVTVKNTPDPGLGNCVAGMMQKATFAKTQTGGSFSYPYTF